jgi:prepilin-type N-terminal cleavage/methylation domain-containing protein
VGEKTGSCCGFRSILASDRPHFEGNQDAAMKNHSQVNRRGFSLVELLIVVAIITIVAAIAIPAVRQTVANYQLSASGTAVASMLETARLTAVKANQPYYAAYNRGGCLNVVCAVSATGSPNPPDWSNYTSADPTVAISGSVAFQDITLVANPPDHLQLDSYLGGGLVPKLGTPIGFNARGLPCTASPTSPFICNNAGGIPAFEWFMQSSMTQGWVAITVSPAGRIRSWRLASTGAAARCGFPACWQ